MNIESIDYIEIYVENLAESIDLYTNKLKFVNLASAEEEDRYSVLIQQGAIRLIITSPKNDGNEVGSFLQRHGDGVKDLAFLTKNCRAQFDLAIKNGAKSILEPTEYIINQEKIIKASVSAFGSISHSFIQRETRDNYVLPFFKFIEPCPIISGDLQEIDHIAICLPEGEIYIWSNFYQKTYGLIQSQEEAIETEYSGMNSLVVQSPTGKLKLVFVEPLPGKNISQIDNYLNAFGGAGVQHLAFLTKDILTAIQAVKKAGLKTLSMPDAYYLKQKTNFPINESTLEMLREYSILVDFCEAGFLYQFFTKPIGLRKTLFFEIIQREGCEGFGGNNIKALFQGIEQEQLISGYSNEKRIGEGLTHLAYANQEVT